MNDHRFVPGQNQVADHEKVVEITTFMGEALEAWLKDHPESKDIEVFMAAHNFHKMVVLGVAKRWEDILGSPKNQTLRVADMTFRQALREERRKL